MNALPRDRVRPNGMMPIKVCHVAHLPKLLAFARRMSMASLQYARQRRQSVRSQPCGEGYADEPGLLSRDRLYPSPAARDLSRDCATHRIAGWLMLEHPSAMGEPNSDFEQAAQIVEAFSESETDERILELLTRIAAAIRDQAIDN